MNKPSERIVVFVTAAQKRAISATADELGISISELMRRAVLAFSATGEQVKAASIVDRLNAPREPDALAQVLRKAANAKQLRERRASPLRPAASAAPGLQADPEAAALAAQDEAALFGLTTNGHAAPAADPHPASEAAQPYETGATRIAATPSPRVPEDDAGNAAREIAQAVARLNAPTPDAGAAHAVADEPREARSATPFTRPARRHGDVDARHDGHDVFDGAAPEDGKFA